MEVGRSPNCQIVADDPSVSRRHALISAVAGGHTIRDVGSTNGTRVNAARISDKPVLLQHGNQIALGDQGVVLSYEVEKDAPEPQIGVAAAAWPPPKSIVPLLIFPKVSRDVELDRLIELGKDKYYTSSPWEIDTRLVNDAIHAADEWLAAALGNRIRWNQVVVVDSRRTLAEWRSQSINLIKDEVRLLAYRGQRTTCILLSFAAWGDTLAASATKTEMPDTPWWETFASKLSVGIQNRRQAQFCLAEVDGHPTPIARLARLAPSFTKRCTDSTYHIPTAGRREADQVGMKRSWVTGGTCQNFQPRKVLQRWR